MVASWYWNHMRWTVLPAYVPRFLPTSDAGVCSCRAGRACDKPGKHPIGPWAAIEHDATAIARWFADFVPWEVNVSLLTGRRSGVVVADTDPRHGGRLETLWELGWPRDTVISRTGSGGWHVLAQCPPEGLRSVAAYAEGIEFKADGTQVILPPSQHPAHRTARYRWLPGHAPWECAVAPLPAAVLAEVHASRAQRSAPAEPIVLTEEQRRELARRAPGYVARAVARVRAGKDGGRHNTGVWLACQLRDLRVGDEVGRWVMLAYQQALEARHG